MGQAGAQPEAPAHQYRIPAPAPRPSSNGRLPNNPRASQQRRRPTEFAPLPPGDFGSGSTEDKAGELCGILRSLEGQLQDPNDFELIGRTYRGLAEWTWEHQQDSDFGEVLALLAPDSKYPAWRRQALEEAYMLFFEDCAKQGNPQALDYLPEPPTSREIGYRPLPEALLDPKTTRGAAFSNVYEAGNACCIRKRWDYDVVRNGPRPRAGEKRAAGRKIVAKNSSERVCAGAVDPMTKLIEAFTPDAFCCGRNRKAVTDVDTGQVTAKDVPSWPPAGGKSRSGGTAANAPSASTKPKPRPTMSMAHDEFSEFPAPPGPLVDNEVPQLANGRKSRADQSLFTEADQDKRSLPL